MNNLPNQIIVIIGAGGGIGRALVSQLAGTGASLALGSRSADAMEKLAGEARSAGAKDVLSHAIDVTDETSVTAFVAAVKAHYGRADTIVYLPGLSVPAPVTEMAVESYDKIMDVNLKGLFLTAKHFVLITQAEHSPLLIFISSQAATRANANAPVYCAAKAAVSMFGQGLALQLTKQNVRVTAIKPGPVDTRGFWGDRPVPRAKFLRAGDVARVIEFVLTLPPHVVMHEVSFESFEFLKK